MLYQVELRPSAEPVLPEGGDSVAKYRAAPQVRQRSACPGALPLNPNDSVEVPLTEPEFSLPS